MCVIVHLCRNRGRRYHKNWHPTVLLSLHLSDRESASTPKRERERERERRRERERGERGSKALSMEGRSSYGAVPLLGSEEGRTTGNDTSLIGLSEEDPLSSELSSAAVDRKSTRLNSSHSSVSRMPSSA